VRVVTCKLGGRDKMYIELIVDKRHVGEPEDKIRALLMRKLKKPTRGDKKLLGCAIRYGIGRHRHNRGVYRSVMSGRF
jgi:hypothetical protein